MQIPSDHHSSLQQSLKNEFAQFRAKSRPGARIPDHLRQAVLQALSSGLKRSTVRGTVGVTYSQLDSWQQCAMPEKVGVKPRILNVIPSVSMPDSPSGLRVSFEAGRLLLELSF